MRFKARVSLLVGVIAGAALAASAFGQGDSGLRFRGVGMARQSLDALQLKPFDQSLWANLSDWSGEPVKSDATEGKVVLIVTWASWHKVSHPAVRTAEAIYEKYKGQGLVAVGVHNPRGFENAGAVARELGVTFPIAADKDGKFRAGLRAEQDPNIYFIDRAGNLRYAQIETGSADDAAGRLVAESAEQARDLPGNLVKQRQSAEKDRWKTSDIKGGYLAGSGPDVPFNAPEDEAYTKVKWPFLVGKVEKDAILERIHAEPPKLTMPGDDDYIPAPPKRAGRLTVVYFVDPRDSDMLRVIPTMNQVQDEYRRDVTVLLGTAKAGQALKSDSSDEGKLKQRNRELIEQMLRAQRVNHTLTTTTIKADHTDFSEESLRPRLSNQKDKFGIAFILSTDDKVRWIGDPYSQDLRRSIDRLIALDPGVQARRKAEDAVKPAGGK